MKALAWMSRLGSWALEKDFEEARDGTDGSLCHMVENS